MGDTQIDWATKSWNVTLGCSRVSSACRFCWAIRTTNRLAANPSANKSGIYSGLVERQPNGQLDWTGEVRCVPERLTEPSHWRTHRRVFVASQSDLWHERVPFEFVDRVFGAVCESTHHPFNERHTWLFLTKRVDRLVEWYRHAQRERSGWFSPSRGTFDLGEVWLGFTAENQEQLDRRAPKILELAGERIWVSIEPMLSGVDLTPYLSGLSWCVAGGESHGTPERSLVEFYRYYGPDGGWTPKLEALDLVRSLQQQCEAAAVPWYWKGWGGPTAKSGGHLLDGKIYHELPEAH